MFTYISNSFHYKEVLSRVPNVKHSLWIGTADIKDLYIEIGNEKKPFLALIAQLIKKGVEVRLIHAKEPGPNFREDFDKYPILYDGVERALCPRVHFKMIVYDPKPTYHYDTCSGIYSMRVPLVERKMTVFGAYTKVASLAEARHPEVRKKRLVRWFFGA